MRCLLIAPLVGLVAYLVWRAFPSQGVVGSYLPNFHGEERQTRMLREMAEQDYNLGISRFIN